MTKNNRQKELLYIIKTIEKYQKDDHFFQKQVLQQFIDRIKNHGICFILFLHHHNILVKIIKKIIDCTDESFFLLLDQLLSYQRFFFMFFKNIQHYKQTYSEFISYIQKKLLLSQKKDQPFKDQIGQILEKIEKILKATQNVQHIKSEIFKIKQNDLQHLRGGHNIYREIAINWLKRFFDVELEKDKKVDLLCCNLYYESEKNMPEWKQLVTQQFKNYIWPFENNENKNDFIRFNLKKVTVAFLNNKGGILYNGFTQEKGKTFTITGIKLKHKRDMLTYIKEKVLDGIFPQPNKQEKEYFHNLFLLQRDRSSKAGLREEPYILSREVSIEFIPVVNSFTLADDYFEQIPVYIIKLKVQPGSNRDVYHVIENQNIITFTKNSQRIERKKFSEFLNIFQTRMKRIQQRDMTPFHDSCLFQFKDPRNIFK